MPLCGKLLMALKTHFMLQIIQILSGQVRFHMQKKKSHGLMFIHALTADLWVVMVMSTDG